MIKTESTEIELTTGITPVARQKPLTDVAFDHWKHYAVTEVYKDYPATAAKFTTLNDLLEANNIEVEPSAIIGLINGTLRPKSLAQGEVKFLDNLTERERGELTTIVKSAYESFSQLLGRTTARVA